MADVVGAIAPNPDIVPREYHIRDRAGGTLGPAGAIADHGTCAVRPVIGSSRFFFLRSASRAQQTAWDQGDGIRVGRRASVPPGQPISPKRLFRPYRDHLKEV